ncbi:MAG TPA: hypothetical protein VKS60_13055 [Stellaceae bacterium]|nr:hypothetical protein [Stellaceae bacterium]
MSSRLRASRLRTAGERLRRFDFGAPATASQEWVEGMCNSLSCRVQLGSGPSRHSVTFRVVFEPASSRVRDIEVGECLPLA